MAMCKVSSSLRFHMGHSSPEVREGASSTSWVPNTDVYLTDGGMVIKVELAGMRREDLELVVEGNRLRISGHRPDGCRPSTCNFLVMEINYGPFETILEVPDGYDLSAAKAAYQNGFLRIDVPQVKPKPAKSISILVNDAR